MYIQFLVLLKSLANWYDIAGQINFKDCCTNFEIYTCVPWTSLQVICAVYVAYYGLTLTYPILLGNHELESK